MSLGYNGYLKISLHKWKWKEKRKKYIFNGAVGRWFSSSKFQQWPGAMMVVRAMLSQPILIYAEHRYLGKAWTWMVEKGTPLA